MLAGNCETINLETALREVNKLKPYNGNIIFNRHPEPVGKRFRFTLRVKDSRNGGARRGFDGKRMVSACWHVHGHFFECLFKVVPDAFIITGKHSITAILGNWVDQNIGSMIKPLYHSEACECNN
ncbi:MAG TPA: hypothetical protein ENH95_02765 [Nitrosopumilus sp.]|nr:hypothetical protein [Nitrosopumilus sp.]